MNIRSLMTGIYCVLTLCAFAMEKAPLVIPEIKTPPKMDGMLDDPAWQNAAKIEQLYLPLPIIAGSATVGQTNTPANNTTVYLARDKTRYPICPYDNDRNISFPIDGDSYNQHAKLDLAYLDEARLLREDIPEEDPLLMERGEDLITEKHLGGFKGQACYYFVRTFRSAKAPIDVRLMFGRTGPFRAWLDGITVSADTNVRGWAIWEGAGICRGRLTGHPQRLVIKLVRLGDHMSLSATFPGGGDPDKKKGISDFLDCLEDLPPRDTTVKPCKNAILKSGK